MLLSIRRNLALVILILRSTFWINTTVFRLYPVLANAMGYLTSVLLRSLEQGPIEERLAKIEATLA